MRVSEHYALGRTQPTLDFVDVDIVGDTRVYVSPRALTLLPSEWGDRCVHLVQNFFETVLGLIKAGDHEKAERLLSALREPNETHLGQSKGKARGRALGDYTAHYVWAALSRSEAAKSGLLSDLEDAVLMIPGISVDIISDMTTNIIREPLIEYTQEMAALYEIPLIPNVSAGALWNPTKREWFTRFERMPMVPSGKLLLVPKAIVRQELQYDSDEYYRHFLLEHMKTVEIDANSSLVELLKDGRKRVTKVALKEKYGSGKAAVVRESLKYPEVLERYKDTKADIPHLPLTHEDFALIEGQTEIDWDGLLAAVTGVEPGNAGATAYERAIESLLTALLYPDLTNPRVQHPIHQGRKRIDITYTNMAQGGFFQWVSSHYPAAHVFVECKNYGREIGNPELDQLSSRFSPSRGRVGILVCRHFEDKDLFLQRCRDTALDDRGFVIALDDTDLAALVEFRKNSALHQAWPFLQRRFSDLVS